MLIRLLFCFIFFFFLVGLVFSICLNVFPLLSRGVKRTALESQESLHATVLLYTNIINSGPFSHCNSSKEN